MNTRKMRNTKGITLVALIVTIIVLLILAGISLNLIMGEKGITQRAVNAGKVHNISGAKEKLELKIADYAGEYYQAKYVNRSVEASDVGSYVLGKFSPEETTFEENYYLKKENSELILTSSDRTTTATCTVDSNGKVEWEGTEIDDDSEESTSGTLDLVDISCVGKYADIDRDGTVDGIIYADLAKGNQNSSGLGQSYSFSAVANGLKSYELSETKYNNSDVVLPLAGTTGTDRFYIMGLTDITNDTLYWYYSAYGNMSDYETATSDAFGSGRANTTKMINKWNRTNGETQYGAQNSRDIWGNLATEYANGWFVPSKLEWAAFVGELGVNYGNYSSTFWLSDYYWTSSQYDTSCAWFADFDRSGYYFNAVSGDWYCVRLSTTF